MEGALSRAEIHLKVSEVLFSTPPHIAAAGQTDKCNPLDLQIGFCIVRDKRKWVFCTIDPRQAGHWQRQVSLLLPLWLNTDNPLKLSLTETWRLWWGGNKKCEGFPWLSWHISHDETKGSRAHGRAQHVHHSWALTIGLQQVFLGQLEGIIAPRCLSWPPQRSPPCLWIVKQSGWLSWLWGKHKNLGLFQLEKTTGRDCCHLGWKMLLQRNKTGLFSLG